ncbi:hypothetical protein [Qingshengfaniella alkalisoli]|nr:hypothetical protein [Qingshengfaniella alkalisoli]
MSAIKGSIEEIWSRLNPAEPSTAYLAKFLGVAVCLFAFALYIGSH